MNIPLIRALLATSVLLTACSSGDSKNFNDLGSPPRISGLQVSPSAVYVGDGGGQTDIFGTFNFSDPDGDLDFLTLEVTDDMGATILSEVTQIIGAGGQTSGTIEGVVTISTADAAELKFSVFVSDRVGHQSNKLDGDFRVADFAWVTKTPMPTPRLEFASATANGLVFVIGGRDALSGTTPKPPVSTLEIYDPAADLWTTGPSMPLPLAGQAAIAANGKIYAFGGVGPVSQTSDTVLEFDPTTDSWSLRTAMPQALTSTAIAIHSGLIYLAGGRSGGMSSAAMLVYDPAADSWQAGTPLSQAREGAAATTADGRILVYGGRNSTHVQDGGYLRSLAAYDPAMASWSEHAEGQPRRDSGVTTLAGLMYAIGGNNVSRSLDWVDVYDIASDAWMPRTSLPSGLAYAQAQAVGDRIIVFGTDTTFEYTPENDIR